MKKKALLPFLLLAVAAAPLTACSSKKADETPTSESQQSVTTDETKEFQEMVQSALDALTVSETATADFTLTTKGAGNVAITWSSDNDAIAVNGADATVTRPGFGGTDATVTLTATAAFQGVTATKTFTVKVPALVDESKTVAAIKELAKDTEVYAKGVVTGFLYGSGNTDPEYKMGFYLTDETGTIYVFGSATAALVTEDSEVYFSAKVGEYSGVKQLTSPENVTVLSETAEADYSYATKLESDAAIQEAYEKYTAGTLVGGETYEMLVQVYANNYAGYAIETTDYTNYPAAFNIYFSGTATAALTGFNKEVKGKDGQFMRVVYYVNSVNSSKKPRGNILAVLPLTDADKEATIEKVLTNNVSLDQYITTDPAMTLPTSLEGYDGYTVEWSVGESTVATITDGVLNIQPTATVTDITLTYTIKKGEETFSTGEYTAKVCTSFEPMTFAEYKAAAATATDTVGVSVLVGGTVTYVTTKGVYITDADGYGYYLYDSAFAATAKVGSTVLVQGEVVLYNGLYEIKNVSVIKNDGVEGTYNPADITDELTTTGLTTDIEQQNRYVTFTGTYTAAKTVTVGNNAVALYLQGDASVADLAIGAKVTVVGITSVFTTSQVYVYTTPVDVTTDAGKVDIALNAVKDAIGTATYNKTTEIDLSSIPYASEVTLTVTVPTDAETLAYDATTKKLTVTCFKVAHSETVTVNVTLGTENSGDVQVAVATQRTAAVVSEVTAAYTNTATTTNMDGTNQAALLGLDATIFSAVGSSGSGKNNIGLNKAGQLRLYGYATSPNAGNGSILTISVLDTANYKINSVTYNFGGTCSGFATVNGTAYTPKANGSLKVDVNGSSVAIQNTITTATTQLWITSIVINYTGVDPNFSTVDENTTFDFTTLLAEGDKYEGTTATLGAFKELSVDATGKDEYTACESLTAWTEGTIYYTTDGTTYTAVDTTTVTAPVSGTTYYTMAHVNGKLGYNNASWTQFNKYTTITFKVKAGATVVVTCYDTNYSVDGTAATTAETTVTYNADATVTVLATGNSYIKSIKVTY